ncbi:hypothetical protein HID58_032517 [Brassica napus]|uniref:BnaA09g09250D protein n=2 Tax=Brassica napus TaxID=3708 RepID=A0A078GYM5_BRANA|nr:uncharacterized protein LOC106362762 [Brassica napus]KAH0909196.1 hypothetical protein HID58_032517 [Brassica napus]CAF2038327.1 unnamed protein product [Brassica napus]CDY30352.1 BnaA09g09250D [Brassica napus]
MDPMESELHNGFATSDGNSAYDDNGWKEVVEYNGFQTSDANHHEYNEWKEVVYSSKRSQKQKPADKEANGDVSDKIVPDGNKQAEDQTQAAKLVAAYARDESVKTNETKKPKPRKKKKKNTKVSLSEAAAKIDPSHLSEFLVKQALEPGTSQLVEFLEYFETAFSQVSAVQFAWMEMFNNNCPLSTVIDVPLSYIPEPVYNASADWIDQIPDMKVSNFVKWGSKNIRTDLAEEEEVIIDCEKDEFHEKVALYVALAMVLRMKPHSLIGLLPAMWTDISAKYRKLDEVPLTVWMMAQASQGDLSVGLYSWAHNLLPLVADKKCNSQSRDYILQLVENILSNPEASTVLVNGTLSEGKRLIPPHVFKGLLRLTFPASSARVKDTERFESIYPFLKEVALAGASGSETMKQIFTSTLNVAGEGNAVLADEATSISIWLLAEDGDCFNLWDSIYEENLEASVALLKKLVGEWNEYSLKLSSSAGDILTLKRTIKSLRKKNVKGITEGRANASLYIEADKSCKVIWGRLSRGSGCLICTAITAVLLAAGGAAAAITTGSFL